jgi:Rod binding domain-containing protein
MSIPAGMAQAISAAERAVPQLKKLHQAAQQMEALFVKDLLTEMQKGSKEGMFGNMPGSEIYQDMFTQSIADQVAKSGSFGFAKTLEQQVTKDVLREAVPSPALNRPDGVQSTQPTGMPSNNQES